MTTLLRHRVIVIFWVATLLSGSALVALWLNDDVGAPLALLSVAINFGSVLVSERRGFIRGRQLRRAHEPPRRYNAIQELVLIALALGEIGFGTFVLLS